MVFGLPRVLLREELGVGTLPGGATEGEPAPGASAQVCVCGWLPSVSDRVVRVQAIKKGKPSRGGKHASFGHSMGDRIGAGSTFTSRGVDALLGKGRPALGRASLFPSSIG